MAYCRKCGALVGTNMSFCPECGSPQEIMTSGVQTNDRTDGKEINNGLKPAWTLIFGLIASIVAVISWFTDPWWVTVLIATVSIAAAIIALLKKWRLKGFAIAAIPIAVLSLVIALLYSPLINGKVTKDTVTGTWVGEDGSVFVFMEDGTADYFFLTDKEPDRRSTWSLDSGRLIIDYKHGSKTAKLDGNVKNGEHPSVLLSSDSKSWRTEKYEKMNSEDRHLSTSECWDFLLDLYGSRVSPSFKESMNAIEEFFDEYIEFMTNYDSSSNPFGLIGKYTEFISKYAEMIDSLSNVKTDELTLYDLVYYYAVVYRVSLKLSEM